MSYAPSSESEILKQLIEGEGLAFRQIYQSYQGKVFLFAFRLTKSKETAEEITQEVFVKLWEKREQIQIEKSFNAYLLTMTRNLIMDFFRRVARDKAAREKLLANIQALHHSDVQDMIGRELQRLHQQAVERLSPQRKIVYKLSREEELSYEEIAERLGISRNTVRNQMTASLKSIREYLNAHEFGYLILALIHLSTRS